MEDTEGAVDTTIPLRSVGVFTVSRPVTPPPPLPPPLLLTATDTGQVSVGALLRFSSSPSRWTEDNHQFL